MVYLSVLLLLWSIADHDIIIYPVILMPAYFTYVTEAKLITRKYIPSLNANLSATTACKTTKEWNQDKKGTSA